MKPNLAALVSVEKGIEEGIYNDQIFHKVAASQKRTVVVGRGDKSEMLSDENKHNSAFTIALSCILLLKLVVCSKSKYPL